MNLSTDTRQTVHPGSTITPDNKTAPDDATNVTRGLTDAPDCGRRPAVAHATERPDPAGKLALIRSIAGHSEGHEDRALTEIAAVLNGATLDELAGARGGA